LKNPVILQGGLEVDEAGGTPFVGAENGDTLSKTAQPVPGGLLGIEAPKSWLKFLQDLFNETINKGFTGVTATVELAAPASSIKSTRSTCSSKKALRSRCRRRSS